MRLSSAGSGSRSLLPQATSPKMPASVSGLACSIRSSMLLERDADVAVAVRRSAQWQPSGTAEAVVVGLDLGGEVVAEVGDGLRVLVVPGVADPLEEQQREDVGLEVGGVDRSAQGVRGIPQSPLQLALTQYGSSHPPLTSRSPQCLPT